MRRITALGLSALALCGVIGTTAGTANADATVGQAGELVGSPRQDPPPPPIGKKHHFHYSIKGSDVTGVWYFAMNPMTGHGKPPHKDRWWEVTVRHTTNDGQQAAVCVKNSVGTVNCLPTLTAKGSTNTVSGFTFFDKHRFIKAALGRAVPAGFITTRSGHWHKLW